MNTKELLKDFFQERGLKSRRLVRAEDIKLNKIKIHASKGQLKVIECPEDVKELHLYRRETDGTWKAYSGEYHGTSELNTWHTLEDVKPGKSYEVENETIESEAVTLYNTAFSKAFYQSRDDRMLECYVCSNDEVILKKFNFESASVGFRSSNEFENCLEVLVDPEPSSVDFYCEMKKDCLVVKNALLARTLMSEGNLSVINDNESSGEKYYIMVPYTGDTNVLQNTFVKLDMGNLVNNLRFLKGGWV